jgi:hypothetical protein
MGEKVNIRSHDSPPTTKVRQGGCPLCWDFPEWVIRNNGKNSNQVEYVTPLQPRDYAFAPGDDPMVAVVQAGGTRIRPPMHTNMTTHTAIEVAVTNSALNLSLSLSFFL